MCQAAVPAGRLHHLPARHASRLVARHERAVPDQEAEHPDRRAVAAHLNGLGEKGVGTIAKIVADDLPAGRAQEEIFTTSIDANGRDLSLDRGRECLARLLAPTRAD